MGMSEMALAAVMKCSPFRYRKPMAKNMAEAWMAWSLKAARNWAISRPMNVRERNEEAGSNADMRASNERAGGTGAKNLLYRSAPFGETLKLSNSVARDPKGVSLGCLRRELKARSPRSGMATAMQYSQHLNASVPDAVIH